MTSGDDPVSELLRRAGSAGLAPGFVGLAVSGDAEGLFWGDGRAALRGAAVGPGTWYDLASLTKPLVTTTLTLLARRDGLELTMPLGGLLPELTGSPWSAVTVEQVLTHTGGFPAWAPLYERECSREAYLAALRALPPESEAGRHVVYSCLGYVALGIGLERAGGADLAVLFSELVAEPLGLADELCFAPPADMALAAGELEPYVERTLLAMRGAAAEPPARLAGVASCDDGNARGLGGVAGNAGLFGTVGAVVQLAVEYLPGGGDLLTSQEAELATRCRTAGLEQSRGLGWQLAESAGSSAGPSLSPAAFGHTGFTGTSVWVDPADRRATALLCNRLHPGGRTADLGPLRRRFNTVARQVLSARHRAA